MAFISISALLPLLAAFSGFLHAPRDLTDVGLTTSEMVKNHGYPAEEHTVTTEDGYILTLVRIPYGKDADNSSQRPAVFLMHGMTSCSADFVVMGPGRSIAYILADAGYDVWIGNARGTAYSRKHISLDPVSDAPQFFNFSWHEIGYYDVAASIDHVLAMTGEDSVYYVGHSQGCTSLLVLTSSRPEYGDKIKLASLMAPAAFVVHRDPLSIINAAAKYVEQVEDLFNKYQIYEIPYLDELRAFAETTCVDPANYDLCSTLFSLIAGDLTNGQIEVEAIPVISTNSPAGTAIKQLIHYAQLIKYGGFTWFNYGPEKNLELYGTETPRPYALQDIRAPIAVYYSRDDEADAQYLITQLPKVANDYIVPYATFNHADFIYAKDVVSLLYNEVLSTMLEY